MVLHNNGSMSDKGKWTDRLMQRFTDGQNGRTMSYGGTGGWMDV